MAATGVFGPHGSEQIGPTAAAGPNVDLEGVHFSDVLRALNPLQYLPVVGTIYRVTTGDAAPSGLREAVSAIMGTLTGGPVGLIGSIAASLAERFFHVEDHLRDALLPTAQPTDHGASPMLAGTATHTKAEADLGRLPASNAPAPTAMAAYHAAGLLGAV